VFKNLNNKLKIILAILIFFVIGSRLAESAPFIGNNAGGTDGVLAADDPAIFNNGVTINEDGGTTNTRIEGDTDVNLVTVDATNDRVGISSASPIALLTVGDGLVVVESGGNVGISSSAPSGLFTVGDGVFTLASGGTFNFGPFFVTSGFNFTNDVNGDSVMHLKNPNTGSSAASQLTFMNHTNVSGTIYTRSDNSDDDIGRSLSMNYTAGNNHYFRSSDQSTSTVILADGGIHFENYVTEPGTPITGAVLYSTGVAANVGELFVKDTGANVTQLSPHNSKGEWIFYSYNTKTGRTVNINMEAVIREVERLSGKEFLIESYTE